MRAEATLRTLLLAAAALSTACQSILVPTAPDANWRVHETTHFLLHARPGSFGDERGPQLAALLEEHYAHVVRTLDLPYAGRITMFLYDSPSDVRPPLPSVRSGIAFPDTESVNVVCVPPFDAGLAALITHETNHVIMGRGIGRPGTRSMNEGMASAAMSEAFFPIGAASIHGWARARLSQLPSMVELTDDERWVSHPQEVAYQASASFLLYLHQRFGSGPIRQLYTVPSGQIERRSREIFGRELTDLEREWREFLSAG